MVMATAVIQTLSRRTFIKVLFGFQSSCIRELCQNLENFTKKRQTKKDLDICDEYTGTS